MILKTELLEWLATLPDDSSIGIDDDGLAIHEIDSDNNSTGAYIEVGGIPEEISLIPG